MAVIGSREYVVAVEYWSFALIDGQGLEGDEDPWATPPPAVCSGGRGWVRLSSGGAAHDASIRLEAHDEAPAVDEGAWEKVDETEYDTQTGTMVPYTMFLGPAGEPVRLGQPGRYRLRAYSVGRQEAGRLSGHTPDRLAGVERWLLQSWRLA